MLQLECKQLDGGNDFSELPGDYKCALSEKIIHVYHRRG